jgi:hypothetical protein
MKTSPFRIVPLRTDVAGAARRATANGAPDHAVITADSPSKYPCRHCLTWAMPGEKVILFPFAAIASGRPYSESGPIFVHLEPCERYAAIDQFPAEFRNGRALRAYNSQQRIIAAEVANGEGPEPVIERFFEKPETAFVHVRSATHGCFTLEVARI